MEVTSKIWKQGNGYVITIPAALIKCKVIDITKPIKLVIEQQKQGIYSLYQYIHLKPQTASITF